MFKILEFDQNKLNKYILDLNYNLEFPVFEFSNIYVLGSLAINRKLWMLEKGNQVIALLFRSKGEVGIFAPLHLDDEVYDFITKNFGPITIIRNFLFGEVYDYLKKRNWQVSIRSENEVIFDLSLNIKLEGKKFRNIRRSKKRLIDSKELQFELVNKDNFDKILLVRGGWLLNQGDKYCDDRTHKDISIIKTSFEKKLGISKIAIYRGVPVGYFCYEIVDGKGISLVIKGLNSGQGVNGISDAIYYALWKELSLAGVFLLNDGSLGTEEGTSSHKKSLNPINFISTYEAKK